MENKQSPSGKKLLSIQEEKLIREVDYDSLVKGTVRLPKKPQLLDLEIFQKSPARRPSSQRVLVSIKPRAPAIKTIYIAEKSRYHTKKGIDKSGSRLAIGDHSSFTSTTHSTEDEEVHTVNSVACGTDRPNSDLDSEDTIQVDSSDVIIKDSNPKSNSSKINVYKTKKRSAEKCYIYTQPQMNMNFPKLEDKSDKNDTNLKKVDIATLIITNTASEDSTQAPTTLRILNKRIENLERKLLRQEMVFRALNPNAPLSSEEENKAHPDLDKTSSNTGRPGCSYIQQYSHVPETSAFQRYAHQAAPLTPSKATNLDKEHNSEQYGRDFTAYDGITARGRRQCASVPCKREDIPKMAAERVHKIRHKLNPIRDYRLMDTVHYLAQGEFAPRDDGIKLTPSREAVLSDIIWEDVCRTHWPNARLGRQRTHSERYSTRCELQRLIDSLLRERVAHVERRRRRHYRIVKLNHRHENCRPLGKTGDIIVASHKNRQNDDITISDHEAGSSMCSYRRWKDPILRRSPKSHDRLESVSQKKRHTLEHSHGHDDSVPGPSYVRSKSPKKIEPTCCYRASSSVKPPQTCRAQKLNREISNIFSSSTTTCKPKNPRLVVKRDRPRKYCAKDEPNLEHYILLPTLVMRTPSNMKRQKKFNELYHRILNVQLNKVHRSPEDQRELPSNKKNPPSNREIQTKKDVGININSTLSDST